MNLYTNLLFLHGYLLDACAVDDHPSASKPGTTATGTDAADTPRSTAMNLFKSLLYLGGLESITSRIGEEEEAFGPTYGNRVASARAFGTPAPPLLRPVAAGARRDGAAFADPVGCVVGGCG